MAFELTGESLRNLVITTARHMGELNEELTSAYPEQPDTAFLLALASAIATTPNSWGDPDTRGRAVDAICANILLNAVYARIQTAVHTELN